MGVKTAGVGHFMIPTSPAAGVSCTSGSANVYTTSAVQLIASTAAALYITGVYVEAAAAMAATYAHVQLMTGTAGAETVIGQYPMVLSTGSTVALGYIQVYPPIPVPAGARLAVKTADSVGAKALLVSLQCIAQSNVVDDAIPVTTVSTVTNAVTLPATAPANWINAASTAADFSTEITTACTASTPTVTLANGAHGGAAASLTLGGAAGLTATHIGNQTGNVSGSVGSVTGAVGSVTGNVGGSVASVTAAVTLPALPANWITAAGINAGALNGKGDWLLASGYAAPPTVSAIRLEMDANSTKLANLDAAVSTRLAGSSYTAPDNASVAAIKTQTDQIGFTAGNVNVNLKAVNAAAVTGAGTQASPWGPA